MQYNMQSSLLPSFSQHKEPEQQPPMRRNSILTCIAIAILFGLAVSATAQTKPLRVFILAGQSNMEGHATVETFDYIGDDRATAPLLKRMRGDDGRPRVCEGVWIS